MRTAVDSSVILDVLIDDPQFAGPSEDALRQARLEGKLLVCDCVIAELLPALASGQKLQELLQDWMLTYDPVPLEAAILAGTHFARYLSRGGSAKRVLPDFLIGAHATVAADRLLARDRGYLRDYFTSLSLWNPGLT